MAVETSLLETDLCKAFGFDPSDVRSLTIRFRVDEVATLEVEIFPTKEQLLKAAGVIKRFKLEPL